MDAGTPLSRGSISTAWRSARANALNIASIRWWALVPYRVPTCTVSFAFDATARKNSSASSESKPAIETTGSSESKRQYGRPETSIAHSPRDSSIGTTAWP